MGFVTCDGAPDVSLHTALAMISTLSDEKGTTTNNAPGHILHAALGPNRRRRRRRHGRRPHVERAPRRNRDEPEQHRHGGEEHCRRMKRSSRGSERPAAAVLSVVDVVGVVVGVGGQLAGAASAAKR